MASLPRPLDYAAYLRTPETKHRYDIVDGVMKFMSPAPTLSHQEILLRITLALHRHVERYQLGKVYPAPADVIISKTPLRTRQPDVMFISNARLHLAQNVMHGGPDLVVEIISPGNTPKYIRDKLCDYASADVREAWVVDPKQATISVLHPENGEFRQTAAIAADSRLRSRVLPRLSLPVRRVFVT